MPFSWNLSPLRAAEEDMAAAAARTGAEEVAAVEREPPMRVEAVRPDRRPFTDDRLATVFEEIATEVRAR